RPQRTFSWPRTQADRSNMEEQVGKLAQHLPAEYPFLDLLVLLPELVLVLGALLLLMIGVFQGNKSTRFVSYMSVLLLLFGAVLVESPAAAQSSVFQGTFVVDGFSMFTKIVLLLGSAAAILMSLNFIRSERIERFEYPLLILFSTLGMMFMAS